MERICTLSKSYPANYVVIGTMRRDFNMGGPVLCLSKQEGGGV
jgi:hypothetical protein